MILWVPLYIRHLLAARPLRAGAFLMIYYLISFYSLILFPTAHNSNLVKLRNAGLHITSLSRNIIVKKSAQRQFCSPAVSKPLRITCSKMAGFRVDCNSCKTSRHFISIMFYLISVVVVPVAQTAYVNVAYKPICNACNSSEGKYGVKLLSAGFTWQGNQCSFCQKC